MGTFGVGWRLVVTLAAGIVLAGLFVWRACALLILRSMPGWSEAVL